MLFVIPRTFIIHQAEGCVRCRVRKKQRSGGKSRRGNEESADQRISHKLIYFIFLLCFPLHHTRLLLLFAPLHCLPLLFAPSHVSPFVVRSITCVSFCCLLHRMCLILLLAPSHVSHFVVSSIACISFCC